MLFLSVVAVAAMAEPVPVLELNLTDPAGAVHLYQTPLPLEKDFTLPAGKLEYRYAVSAEAGEGGEVTVEAVLYEVKKGKEKAVSSHGMSLKEGVKKELKSSTAAPKGFTDSVGAAQTVLQWNLEGLWLTNGEAGEETAAGPAGEYVLVWPGAGLYADPEDTEPALTLGEASVRMVTEAPPVSFRLVELGEAFAEVEALDSASQQALCQPPSPLEGAPEGSLFVRLADLAPATTAPISLSHEDGALWLAPGVAAQCDASGRCVVGGSYSLQAIVALPPESVGTVFSAGERRQPLGAVRGIRGRGRDALLGEIGGGPVALPDKDPIPALAIEGVSAPTVTVGDACSRYTLHPLPSQIEALPDDSEE
jgi:hypothetical protein